MKCQYCRKAATLVCFDVDGIVECVCDDHLDTAKADCNQMPGAWHVEQLSGAEEIEAEDGEFQR